MTLYIPSELNSQKKFINANTKIENLLINLNELRSKLWNSPKKINDISKEITSFEKDDSIEKWIKALPFTLALIL